MASEWWWFLVLNVIVAAIAVLSKVRPSSSPGHGGITRRASSAVLQRLRSSLFSFPSANFTVPEAAASAATVSRETDQPAEASPAKPASTPRSLARTPRPARSVKVEEEEEDAPNAMSMEEAYALVQAARRRPESERKEEARGSSDVDAKAEEFIQGFKEDLRQQRMNSIFNYTQMLKKRAFGDGRRQPAAQPDQRL